MPFREGIGSTLTGNPLLNSGREADLMTRSVGCYWFES
jgi:hypothetical protein